MSSYLVATHTYCSYEYNPYFPLYLSISARFSSLLNWLFIHHYGSVWGNDQELQSAWNNFPCRWSLRKTFFPYLEVYNLIWKQQKENSMLEQLPQWETQPMTTSRSCRNITAINENLGKKTEICCQIIWISTLIHEGKMPTYVIKCNVNSHSTNIW